MSDKEEVLEEVGKLIDKKVGEVNQEVIKEVGEKLDKSVADIRAAFSSTPTSKSDPLILEQFKKMTTDVSEAIKGGNEIRDQLAASEGKRAELETRFNDIELKMNQPDFNTNEKTNEETEKRAKQVSVFFEAVRSGSPDSWKEYRALADYQSGADSNFGYRIPVDFEKKLMTELENISVMRGLCSVSRIKTDRAEFGGVSSPTVTWGPGDYVFSDIAMDVSQMGIHDVKGGSLISNNLLEDTDVNLMKTLSSLFAIAIEVSEEIKFTNGGGANIHEPMGFLTDTDVLANFTVSGDATTIPDLDGLQKARYALHKSHRKGAVWVMNSDTEAALAIIQDTTGRYIWQPSVIVGTPSTLFGISSINNETMPDIGADAFAIVYANFKNGYKIKDRTGIETKILKERYAEKDQTAILVKKRTGGSVVMPSAFQCLKVSA